MCQSSIRIPRRDRAAPTPVGEDPVLAGHQGGHPGGDGGQLLAGAEPVGRAGPQSGRHLVLEAGHPDLEELVETLGEDGQELHPLEQRLALVVGQVEESVGELEPGQLAVGEPLRGLRQRHPVGHRGRASGPRPNCSHALPCAAAASAPRWAATGRTASPREVAEPGTGAAAPGSVTAAPRRGRWVGGAGGSSSPHRTPGPGPGPGSAPVAPGRSPRPRGAPR